MPRKLIGLVMEGGRNASAGRGGIRLRRAVRRVTSAGLALYLQQGVAMALVNRSFLEEREHAFTVETDRESRLAKW
ncbi:MAG: glycine cleavage T C-terminal barrel domain-containing protein [Christensenellales bacterium]